MREIKFRAWDKKGNCMLTWGAMCQSALNNEKANLIRDVFVGYKYDLILMQYTGFKDRNDKEIYEGDIVNIRYQEQEGRNFPVMWVDGRWSINGFSSLRNYIGKDEDVFVEILGNVFQNSELLNE